MKSLKKYLWIALALCLLLAALPTLAQEGRLELLPRNAQWYYLDDGQDLGADWYKAPDYSAWKQGAGPLGFGDDVSETDPSVALGTKVSYGDNENDKHMTTYLVTSVNIPSLADLAAFAGAEVYVHVDDGAVVYLNGAELFRRGIDEGVQVGYSTGAKFKPKEETFVIGFDSIAGLVKEGENLILAEVHQDDGGSSDLWFELGIVAVSQEALQAAEASDVEYTKTALPNPEVKADAVTRLTMSYNGDPATQMGFTWYTNQGSVGTDLDIVPYADNVDFAQATRYTGRFSRSSSAPEYLVHKATANGLTPGQKYAFRAGDAKLDLWSATGSFTTDNADDSFVFLNVADAQAKDESEAKLSADTFAIAYATVPDSEFMVINGDVVDTGLKEEQWGWVFGAAQDTLGRLPFIAVSGNHDEDKQSFAEHFNLEAPQGSLTDSGVYYSFDYGPAHFIMLNTNEDSPEYANFTPAQIAVMHKGPYTTSNHATDGDIMDANGVRSLVAPIFADLGIDLVLQGHDHIYALSKPIQADGQAQEPETQTISYKGQDIAYMVNPQGVVYMIPNTAGPKVYYKNKTILDSDPGYYDKFVSAQEHPAAQYATEADAGRPPRSIIQNFVGIEVSKDSISAIVYEIDRNKGDTPYILDTFGLLKK